MSTANRDRYLFTSRNIRHLFLQFTLISMTCTATFTKGIGADCVLCI